MGDIARDTNTRPYSGENQSLEKAKAQSSSFRVDSAAQADDERRVLSKIVVVSASSPKLIRIPYKIEDEIKRKKNLLANSVVPPADTGIEAD